MYGLIPVTKEILFQFFMKKAVCLDCKIEVLIKTVCTPVGRRRFIMRDYTNEVNDAKIMVLNYTDKEAKIQ